MPITDHNTALRTAYFSALSGIAYNDEPIGVYCRQVPDNPGPLYIEFHPVSNTNNSAKQEATLNNTMQVGIYTEGLKYHSEDAVDLIAGEVLQRITAGLTLQGFQIVSTELTNDFTQDWQKKAAYVAIDRILTFRHIIFQGTE